MTVSDRVNERNTSSSLPDGEPTGLATGYFEPQLDARRQTGGVFPSGVRDRPVLEMDAPLPVQAAVHLVGDERVQDPYCLRCQPQVMGACLDQSRYVRDVLLREADLAAGRFDAAAIESWLGDWSAPELRVLIARGTLGEVRREGSAFTAELRGLAARAPEVPIVANVDAEPKTDAAGVIDALVMAALGLMLSPKTR